MMRAVLAEFGLECDLIAAVEVLRGKGYTRLDAFTPYPVKGLEHALGLPRSRLAAATFPFAVLGGVTGYMIQWYCNTYNYPLNVGGRPLHPWPAFIPITFESIVLMSGIAAFMLYLGFNRYPEPSNPIFAIPGFDRATTDRFWLAIDGRSNL